MPEPRFITFEGVDGCGKTTQLRQAGDWLSGQGFQVCTTREPGDTPLGVELRRLLLDSVHAPVAEAELFMFLADRAQHVREVMLPALARGEWVLCDRYSDSTMAYQLAARKLATSANRLADMLVLAECNLRPTLTLWFDVPPAIAQQRMQARNRAGEENTRLDNEAAAFHASVAAAFSDLWSEHPERVQRIDAAGSIEGIHRSVRALIGERFGLAHD